MYSIDTIEIIKDFTRVLGEISPIITDPKKMDKVVSGLAEAKEVIAKSKEVRKTIEEANSLKEYNLKEAERLVAKDKLLADKEVQLQIEFNNASNLNKQNKVKQEELDKKELALNKMAEKLANQAKKQDEVAVYNSELSKEVSALKEEYTKKLAKLKELEG